MVDKVTLQILANHVRAAAENMAYTLYRTAHSTFVKETEDFTTMLTDPAGLTVAVPMDLGATWYPGINYGRAIDLVEGGYEPGDIAFTNDPYSGYLATHAPDIHAWKPVFHEGEIVAFAGGHIHNTDMGGAVPASLSRTLTEIHQEGIRFPPMKLYQRGEMDEKLLKVMLLNVRKPDQNLGDLKALVGALNTGERKVQAMVRKFGLDTFRAGLKGLLDYAEHQAREVLRSIPDGEYRFADYTDEDGETGNPCRLVVTLRIAGDEAVLDFTGSDPQLTSSLNVPTGSDPRHTLLLVGVYYVLYTLNRQLVLNAGLTRPFTCIVPEGTVLNPLFPAAVGMRSLTCARLRSLLFGVFGLAIPDRMPAAPAGSSSIVNVMTTDDKRNRTVIAALNPVVGGGGGMPHRDGTNGSGADSAYLKNTPIEINEAEVPVQFLRYGLQPDWGAPGATEAGSRPSWSSSSSPRTAGSRSATATARASAPGASWAAGRASPRTSSSIPARSGRRCSATGTSSPWSRATWSTSIPRAGAGEVPPPSATRRRCASTSSAATCRPRGRRWITASCSATGKWTRPPPPHGAPP